MAQKVVQKDPSSLEELSKSVQGGLIDPLKAPVARRKSWAGHGPEHWSQVRFPEDRAKDDFRVFLTLMWKQLNLPTPTPLQLSIAWHLQKHGWTASIDRLVIMAFRGCAKSWITAAYVLWNLHRNPQLKIGVVSGSGKRAVMFVSFCLKMVDSWSLLSYLKPGPHNLQSSTGFDVAPCTPDQTPSVWAAGITSQIVGYRADIIVGDDVETNTNSLTEDMRDKIRDNTKEFDSIIKPGGQIIFLGTPQTEASIYSKMPERGFAVQIWPARYPTGPQQRVYGGKLAKYILARLEKAPELMGTPTEPTRFSEEDLESREKSKGKAEFALQFMLDTTLSDVDKYPLRLGDLICMSLDIRRGPESVSWGQEERLSHRDVFPIALDGDRVYAPASVSEQTSPWQTIKAFVDPSGKGKDEATLTIGAVLFSTPFVLFQRGYMDGYGPETLKDIAKWLVFYKVQVCRVEEDFGQGMFAQLLRPYVVQAWKEYNERVKKGLEAHSRQTEGRTATLIESERAQKMQKELRILEVLEPLFNAHRLVVAKEVFLEDYRQIARREGTDHSKEYSLMYQITRLAREKDCLGHDDRVEGLAGLMMMFAELLGIAPADGLAQHQNDEWEELFEKLEDEERGLRNEGVPGGKLRGNLRTGRDRIKKA